MHFKKAILFIILIIPCSLQLFAQNYEFKQYAYDNDIAKLHFSFDIPQSWIINNEYDGTGYMVNCSSANDSDKITYANCFDGIVFRVKYLKGNLDTALFSMGVQKKSDGIYLTSYEGKIKIEIPTVINGKTYNGLYYTITNDIYCKIDKRKRVMGNFQFIYFSDGIQTICISTNGRSFDENVFKQIIDSFKFN